MYAVGQGALAVECREDDSSTVALLSPLSHRNTTLAVIAERALMWTLEGGCSAPVAVHTKVMPHLAKHPYIFICAGKARLWENNENNLLTYWDY